MPDSRYFVPLKGQRQDRWLWEDKDSNQLLIVESRIPDPWVGEVAVLVSWKKTSGDGKTSQRTPTVCKLMVFDLANNPDAIPAQVDRFVYASRFAYTEPNRRLLMALSFPWEPRLDRVQLWLRYEFLEVI